MVEGPVERDDSHDNVIKSLFPRERKNLEKNPAPANADVEGWLCVDSTDISSEQEAEEDKTDSAIK